jgi:hypothetical protein
MKDSDVQKQNRGKDDEYKCPEEVSRVREINVLSPKETKDKMNQRKSE